MGVQGTYLRPQTKFEKITDRRFRPEFPAVSTNNHRPRFPPLGYFPENGARGAEYFREIRVLFLHSFMDQPRLAGVVYQESGSGALDFPQDLLKVAALTDITVTSTSST